LAPLTIRRKFSFKFAFILFKNALIILGPDRHRQTDTQTRQSHKPQTLKGPWLIIWQRCYTKPYSFIYWVTVRRKGLFHLKVYRSNCTSWWIHHIYLPTKTFSRKLFNVTVIQLWFKILWFMHQTKRINSSWNVYVIHKLYRDH